ncbi:MAG: MFS transporter [Trueperaceae bacterium]
MRSRAALVGTFLLAYLLSYFYRSTNAVLAGDLQRDAGLSPEQLGTMTSLFFVTFALAQLPLGSALDRWGPRIVTPSLMFVTVVGSLVTAAATDFAGLAVGRALIGLGMAGVLMGALKAMASWFPAARFATMSSVFIGVGSLGALGATTPLHAFANALGWRPVFLVAAGVTAAVALALVWVVRADPPVDRVNGAARTASDDGEPGLRAPAVASVHFAQIFTDGSFWRLALLVLALAGSLFAFQGLWGGPFMVAGLGIDRSVAAQLLLVLGVAATVGYLLAGPMASRWGVDRTIAIGAAVALAALVALAVMPREAPFAMLAIAWSALGLGSSTKVLSYAAARARFPTSAGHAITAANLFAVGGTALLQAGLGVVVGAVASAMGHPDDPPLLAYRAAMWAAAFLLAVALVGFTAPSRSTEQRVVASRP